jgi:hypothetical protein
MPKHRIAALAALLVLVAAPAGAGPLNLGLPSLPGTVGGVVNRTTGTLNQTVNSVDQTLTTTLHDAVGRPRGGSAPRVLDKDVNGFRIVRGEILVLSPSDKSLAIARGLNFDVLRQDNLASLGMSVTVLHVPEGTSTSDGLATLRKADPEGAYDVDHVYDPSGGAAEKSASASSDAPGVPRGLRIGMIDGGVEQDHRAFAHSTIVAQGFIANGSASATSHGTAVASLLVGSDDDVSGALPGATLYAADVYCGRADGGSANAIAEALAWLAQNNVPVANVSLSGPPNAVLGAAVNAFLRRGHVLVAAVGNDGPAAGVEYPAGYPGVAGVTAVDDKHGIQLEANRGADVAFAARGVEVSAASLNNRHDTVTGTSFAAPIVAARFALLVPRTDPRLAANAWTMLERAALHLGPEGRNDTYGYGFLERPPSLLNATAAR